MDMSLLFNSFVDDKHIYLTLRLNFEKLHIVSMVQLHFFVSETSLRSLMFVCRLVSWSVELVGLSVIIS